MEDKNNQTQKPEWCEPEIFVLDFRETKSGPSIDDPEDVEYDGYSV